MGQPSTPLYSSKWQHQNGAELNNATEEMGGNSSGLAQDSDVPSVSSDPKQGSNRVPLGMGRGFSMPDALNGQVIVELLTVRPLLFCLAQPVPLILIAS